MPRHSMLVFSLLATSAVLIQTPACPAAAAGTSADEKGWREAEAGVLANHVQLTFAEQFHKAGEAYFSPDDSMIIFQAVEAPPAGQEPDDFYAMYVAHVVRDESGRITGLDSITRLSPPGSANTCGWFHPTDPNEVIFSSTIGPPGDATPPGFERLSGRYRWMFPREMKIVRCRLDRADGTAASLEVLVGDDTAYQAECVLSPDGRHLLFCSMEPEERRGDLYVKDLATGVVRLLVGSNAYDGGPFFSPDGRRVCFRSDRREQHYLQLFVGELEYDRHGSIIGMSREYQLTDDANVNWCPFWHPNGRGLLYSTSALGHENYEVFLVDADPGDLPGSTGSIKYGTRRRRVTHAARADVLPAFDSTGRTMIWTSQRGADGMSQLWVADFLLSFDGTAPAATAPEAARATEELSVEDPETGLYYLYDPATHRLTKYDPRTHVQSEVTDEAEIQKAMQLFKRDASPVR